MIKSVLILLGLVYGWMISGSENLQGPKWSEEIMQKSILVGEFTRADLEKPPFASWFEKNYRMYQPRRKAMKVIRKNIADYQIRIFIGTWCPDSRREIPRFFKLLDQAGYDSKKVTGIAVDRSKGIADQLDKELNLKMVPTIIFYKDGKEVNRFVEFPQQSLEADLADIVSGKAYRNPYETP